MAQADTATVRKHIVVGAPIEQAFTVFTERFGDFKPPEHNMLGAPIAETVFEPRAGGGIVDRAADGSECRWARILAYDPPSRVVFSWDISPRWTIETDQANTSEVEVRFYAESPTEIGRPAEEVFAYATDPARFSGWQPGVVEGHMDGPGGCRCRGRARDRVPLPADHQRRLHWPRHRQDPGAADGPPGSTQGDARQHGRAQAEVGSAVSREKRPGEAGAAAHWDATAAGQERACQSR
jgi:uncharacterized protein YndB with AHSA1/START domain